MAPRSPDAACPCGSGRKFKRCCRRLHQGHPAADAEALMRSRYSAYAVGEIDYVIATTDPDSRFAQDDRDNWAQEIRAFSQHTRFEKLEVREVAKLDADHAEVLFHAKLSRDGEDVSFTERSSFTRRDGRWFYVDGTHPSEPA